MNKEESGSIVKLLAGADGRIIDETTFAAWYLALEPYVHHMAAEAAVLCMRDEKITRQIQPRDVISKIGVIRDRLQADQQRARALEPEEDTHGVSQPICYDHDLPIMRCDACIAKTGKLSSQTGGTDSKRFHSEWFKLIGRVVA
jgi:hypothetical protein